MAHWWPQSTVGLLKKTISPWEGYAIGTVVCISTTQAKYTNHHNTAGAKPYPQEPGIRLTPIELVEGPPSGQPLAAIAVPDGQHSKCLRQFCDDCAIVDKVCKGEFPAKRLDYEEEGGMIEHLAVMVEARFDLAHPFLRRSILLYYFTDFKRMAYYYVQHNTVLSRGIWHLQYF